MSDTNLSETPAVAPATAPAMDPSLLAKLTGGLGDRQTVERICGDFGQLYTGFLPDVFHAETGIAIQIGYVGCESGLMTELVADLGDTFSFVNGGLRNWCPNFVLACGNAFVISLMELMLGGEEETIEQPAERPLSEIELDLAAMVFERIGSVLRSGVNAEGGFEPMLEPPHNADDRAKHEPEARTDFGAVVRLSIEMGKVKSELALVIPQRALLRTRVELPRPSGQIARSKQEWSDRISEQVRRSQVTLEARIRLEKLTLSTISRLAAGDVIGFEDKGDVSVQVSANGKDMYLCEFGRAGERYTVRVKDNIGSEQDIIKHLAG
ncbi:FliM/FliN family flagellar motor switch protein [Neorhizobium sp. NPDC001467]|uniref:FliM/FliN family flagellar motor switch protein n=1 Tax=Neorhizobium sp. NPDC001467 TaxID=3390595 RepID=UPI003CFD3041